jgi:MSHA biogenesis protein MshI
MQPGALMFAHGVCGPAGKCAINRCGTRELNAAFKDADRVAKDLGVDQYQCLTLLSPTDYQLLLVEAPNVPAVELKTAVRWRVKDMLDYRLDDATIDVLDIPVARNDTIKGCIDRFRAAHIPLSVIDIAETAQRNIAALYEPPDRGVGLLYLGPAHALLTINFRGELYLARRIEVGVEQLLRAGEARQDEAMTRILLELQRSFDHLDRQFPFVTMAKLLLGPEPRDTGLATYLSANLDLPVEAVRLSDVLSFGPGAAPEGDAAWRLFHVLGAALRSDVKTP